MFGGPAPASGGYKQSATASNTFTAAGTAAITPTLPGGASGRPVRIRASGSVAGYVTLNIGTQAQIVVMVNPNAPQQEQPIPASAFPNAVNSVATSATAAGAGLIVVTIDFA